jgi:hypothetical protein
VLIFGYHRSDRGEINRWEALLLLCCFIGYQALLYHDAIGGPTP